MKAGRWGPCAGALCPVPVGSTGLMQARRMSDRFSNPPPIILKVARPNFFSASYKKQFNMNEPLPSLPALRHLGELAERLPTVVIDSREQIPLPFTRLPTIRAGLYSGDYSIAGLEDGFSIERKSIDDLVGCCVNSNRERFENELHRLRGFRFKRLLIIGQRVEVELKHYRSAIAPASVLGTLAAFEVRYDCPVVWASTPEAAAALVERWAWYYAREHVEQVNGLFRGTAAMPTTP